MLERETLKVMIETARRSAEHEEQAQRKYMGLAKQAEAQMGKHRAELGALTQLLELYYPDEKPTPF